MFSLVASLAGAYAVVQAVGRLLPLAVPADSVAFGLGASRRTRRLAVALPLAAAVAAGIGLGLVVAVAAHRTVAKAESGAATGRRRTARRHGGGWNAPLPVAIGLRALGGTARTTTRSAAGGAVVAVAGVVAVLCLTASVDRASADPPRYGWAWTTSPDVNSQDSGAAAAIIVGGPLSVGGRTVYSYALDVRHGTMDFTLLEGELPSGPGEIALGRHTVEERRRRFADGVDREAAEARLASQHDLVFNDDGPPPGSLQQLDGMALPLGALAAFLAAIGVIGLLQHLAVSVRQRRLQHAVLRALGLERARVRRSVVSQAVALALVGVAGSAVLAFGPGWYAARRHPAEVLRTE